MASIGPSRWRPGASAPLWSAGRREQGGQLPETLGLCRQVDAECPVALEVDEAWGDQQTGGVEDVFGVVLAADGDDPTAVEEGGRSSVRR
jgi:hypothetical protein